jgi:amino acid permease
MAAATDAAQEPREPELQRSLKPRHMTMIALGGIIGAGLFAGSSAVIGTVGPGAVVSYLAAGVLVILVSIVAIVCVIGSMALVNDEATRSYLVPSLISLAVVLAAAFIKGRLERGRGGVKTAPGLGPVVTQPWR